MVFPTLKGLVFYIYYTDVLWGWNLMFGKEAESGPCMINGIKESVLLSLSGFEPPTSTPEV